MLGGGSKAKEASLTQVSHTSLTQVSHTSRSHKSLPQVSPTSLPNLPHLTTPRFFVSILVTCTIGVIFFQAAALRHAAAAAVLGAHGLSRASVAPLAPYVRRDAATTTADKQKQAKQCIKGLRCVSLTRPICPICHTPFFPYITGIFFLSARRASRRDALSSASPVASCQVDENSTKMAQKCCKSAQNREQGVEMCLGGECDIWAK